MKRYTFNTVDIKYATDAPLGALYSKEYTEFHVWSPLADSVQLQLWRKGSDIKHSYPMSLQRRGVWSVRINGDLDGSYYTYVVTSDGTSRETIDIYAKACDINGKRGLVFAPQRANIDGWENESTVKLDSYADAVIYELHIRDYSMDSSGSFIYRGKYAAFSEIAVTNNYGDKIGLDHIAELGVTHIHLLPVMDFASVDEAAPTFNWGYDPLNYNIPEGSYSSAPTDGIERIRELKRLVSAVHRRGMGVILDVVYNHTFDAEDSPFGKIFPHYYYRHYRGKYSNGSGCGNELATERAMVSRYICDSLCYLAQEYKLDGFRFDLMGLIDTDTLNVCAEKLRKINPCIILYGEGWTGGASLLPENERALKHNAQKVPQYAMFSDDIRDAIKGSVFNDADRGYVNGACDDWHREQLCSSLVGGIYHPQLKRKAQQCWASSPLQSINYVEAHDNLTLYDKLQLSMPEATEAQRIAADKMAAALVILAQGVPFIQAGQEFLRSKPLPDGGFDHNSYKSPDSVNSLKWDELTVYREISDYYKGLIAIRRRFPHFRLIDADDIREALHFRRLRNGSFVMTNCGFSLITNPTDKEVRISSDSFDVYADAEKASAEPMYCGCKRAIAKPHSILLIRERTELQKTIDRVITMERYFNELISASREDIENSIQLSDGLEHLIAYYENGEWLSDYERDERGELPRLLKRGVLSQDGLYDLFIQLGK